MEFEKLEFEKRYLQPYAEPVEVAELEVGAVYYGINYSEEDNAMVEPIIETLVYLGINLENDDGENFYFQDYNSYHDGARMDDDSDCSRGSIYFGPKDKQGTIGHIFKYEKALEEFIKLSLKREDR